MLRFWNPIKKPLFVFALVSTILPLISSSSSGKYFDNIPMPAALAAMKFKENYHAKYDSLGLEKVHLSEQTFQYAMQGFEKMVAEGALQNTHVLSIVDFTLPSAQKRLFIIDLVKNKLLFNTYVAHGRNSGNESATSFSNDPESNKSSLGFYVTMGTYRGENGYSLRLEGMEEGINNNAFSRNIVLHGAPYVSERMIASKGYLGRSLGCPAVPLKLHRAIISKIKDGSCLFLFGQDVQYTSNSKFLRDDEHEISLDSSISFPAHSTIN